MQNLSVKRRWLQSAIQTSRRSTSLAKMLPKYRHLAKDNPELIQAIKDRQKQRQLH